MGDISSFGTLSHALTRDSSHGEVLRLRLSPATISKLGRDDYVSMDVLVRICNALKVRIEDIVEVLIED